MFINKIQENRMAKSLKQVHFKITLECLGKRTKAKRNANRKRWKSKKFRRFVKIIKWENNSSDNIKNNFIYILLGNTPKPQWLLQFRNLIRIDPACLDNPTEFRVERGISPRSWSKTNNLSESFRI